MTVGTATRPAAPATLRDRRPGRAAVGAAVRLARRGTVIVALIAGGLPAFVAVEYRDTFSGAIGASSLTGLAENPAIRTLFGRPVALDDPGGFTVWRTGTVLAVFVGTWAVLTATRLTRGEGRPGAGTCCSPGGCTCGSWWRTPWRWSCSRPPSRVRR
jgi:ABC-2 type transport system permease protein